MSDVITRGEGFTPSERRLAALADCTFLRLWSYPNTFNDRTKNSSGGGQEFTDLLAVCENHVVLFSDKEIGWQLDKPLDLAWARWFRRAVEGASIQLKGAERWLDQHPDRIFTDKLCTQRLPISLARKDVRVVHLVAVVSGAQAASREYFNDSRGTIMIQPALRGAEHVNSKRPDFRPFTIGDINPDGTFIHVFDPIGLEIVMKELDTVADLTGYLAARSKFLRTGQAIMIAGEEHLLATYMMNGFKNGRPTFISNKLRKKIRRKTVVIPPGQYEVYISSRLHVEIEQLKKRSMLWDIVLELLIEDVLKGTSISILNEQPTIQLSDQVLRIMAFERRIDRVSLAQALLGAMERCLDEGMSHIIRRVFISRTPPNKKIGYVFLVLPRNPEAGTLEEYRAYRSGMLSTYCLSVFLEQPKLDIVVGLALDIFRVDGELRTRSEDAIAVVPPQWSPELLANLEADRVAINAKHPRELKAIVTKRRVRSAFKDTAQ